MHAGKARLHVDVRDAATRDSRRRQRYRAIAPGSAYTCACRVDVLFLSSHPAPLSFTLNVSNRTLLLFPDPSRVIVPLLVFFFFFCRLEVRVCMRKGVLCLLLLFLI